MEEEWEEAFAKATGETPTASNNEESPSNDTETEHSTEVEEVAEDTAKAGNPTEEQKPNPQPTKPNEDIHKRNNANAQRRIRNRERDAQLRLQANKIQRLQDEENKLASKPNLTEYEQSRLDNLRTEREDITDAYNAMQSDVQFEEVEDFNHQVAEELEGFYDPNQAIEAIQEYAPYVNENEPLLAEVSLTEKYGKHLLAEWCVTAKKTPTALESWKRMPMIAKIKWIGTKLDQINAIHNNTATAVPSTAPNTPTAKPPVNVGVAKVGRGQNSNHVPSKDDFGALIEAELQKMGKNKI